MFETLLLNFLLLLLPVVMFLIFFENRPQPYNRKLLVLLAAITMSLCMLNPIRLDAGFIFDLRYMPFIIVALFGGYRCAIPMYVVLNVVRFYLGGEGILNSFIFSTLAVLIIPLYSRTFMKLSPKGRVTAATVTSLINLGSYLISLIFVLGHADTQFWVLTANAITTYAGVMSVLMILIEKIIANIRNRDRIMQSDRLNVVSELAASVSHEIRNPLTVTSGFLQLLNKSTTMTKQEKWYIDLSLQELNRAEKIVSDYLSFAKPQSDNMVYSNMSDEFEYTQNIIMPYASIHEVKLEFQFDNALHTNYDRNQIQQCLINLYKNGIEAMKETGGGTLRVDVSERKQNIIVCIQDTGVGMTKDEISRLGKPYYSTKEEGTGLGMLMVYSTLDKLKGTIEVQSEKGQGTIFQLTIPAQRKSVS